MEQKIQDAANMGDPVIVLPFDTYPIVEKEMNEAGWIYGSYNNKDTGKKCAIFYPKQYENGYEYEEE